MKNGRLLESSLRISWNPIAKSKAGLLGTGLSPGSSFSMYLFLGSLASSSRCAVPRAPGFSLCRESHTHSRASQYDSLSLCAKPTSKSAPDTAQRGEWKGVIGERRGGVESRNMYKGHMDKDNGGVNVGGGVGRAGESNGKQWGHL